MKIEAMTTKEFDTKHKVKISAPYGIRPLMPIVPCSECERLKAENEAYRSVILEIWDMAQESIREETDGAFTRQIEANSRAVLIKYQDVHWSAREIGAIE